MKRKQRNKVERRGLKTALKSVGYGAAASATLALAAAEADAAVIVNNTPQPITSGTMAFIDFDGGGNEFSVSYNGSSYLNLLGPVGDGGLKKVLVDVNYQGNTSQSYPNALPTSTIIGSNFQALSSSSSLFRTIQNITSGNGNFPLGEERFLGVKFDIGAGDRVGYIGIKRTDAHTGVVTGYAYEDGAGGATTIHTESFESQPPAIPEPGSLLTLALGAAGLFAWRRHRMKQAEKQDNETAEG